jgi:hypothetical protein
MRVIIYLMYYLLSPYLSCLWYPGSSLHKESAIPSLLYLIMRDGHSQLHPMFRMAVP